jgi:hypothetical protein
MKMPEPIGWGNHGQIDNINLGYAYIYPAEGTGAHRPVYDKQALIDLLEAAISAISKDEIRGKVLPFGINPPSEGLSLGQEWALEAAQAAIRSMKGKL